MSTQLTVKLFSNERTLNVVNPDDKDFYNRLFAVALAKVVTPDLVYADYTQEALDIYADYCEQQGWLGYFLDHEVEQDLAQYDEVSYLGNHCRPVASNEIFVQEVNYQ